MASEEVKVCNCYFEDLFPIHKTPDGKCSCGLLVREHPRQSGPLALAVAPVSAAIRTESNITSLSLIDKLPKWGVDFKQAKPFFITIQQVFAAANLPQHRWITYLPLTLPPIKYNERSWIQKHILEVEPSLSWPEAKIQFALRFENIHYHRALERDYNKCRQFNNESVQEYCDRFSSLVDELGHEDSNEHVITKFKLGLSATKVHEFEKAITQAEWSGKIITLDSLSTTMQKVLELDRNDQDHQSEKSANSQNNRDKKNNSSNSATKKHCDNHPASSSHSTAECHLTKAKSNSTNKPQSDESKPTPVKPGWKCVICQGNHHPRDCPNKSSIQTRSQQQQPSHSVPSASTPSSTATPTSQARTLHVTSDAVEMDRFSTIDRNLPADIFKPKACQLYFMINGVAFNTLVDTGANVSFMDTSLTKKLGLPIIPVTGNIALAHESSNVERIGQADIKLSAIFPCVDRTAIDFQHTFELLPIHNDSTKDYHFIVGCDLIRMIFPNGVPLEYLSTSKVIKDKSTVRCQQLEIQPAINQSDETSSVIPMSVLGNNQSIVQTILENNPEIHENGIGEIPDQEQPTRLTLSTPAELEIEYLPRRLLLLAHLKTILEFNEALTGFCNLPEAIVELKVNPDLLHTLYRRQYPLAHMLIELAHPVIMRWLDTGKICLAPPGCQINNPITIAPKKDENGKWTGIRVCLDTRALNLALINDDKFEIPNIRNALETLGGNQLFGEFDLSEAYLQFPLHPDSRMFTAFTWKGQQYMFVGAPYGIKLLPSFFQRIMSRIFYDFLFTLRYIDNFPFASPDWETHQEHALLIIQRLNQVNLRIKPSSVNLGHAQIKSLGHILSIDGVSIDPDKLQAVRDWPLPDTGAGLQSFLGLCSFIRQHVRHFAELTASLESIKYCKKLDWTDELVQDFEATKIAVSSAPILVFPNPNLPFHIATDASNTGVGGVLFQPKDDTEHITSSNMVAICSKKLQPSQQNWPAYKKELYAIVYSLRKFHVYVWGRLDLVIITDHKPLTYIFSSKTLSPALQQWLDVILDYSFTIQHRDGILNVIPDQLSRMFTTHYAESDIWGASSQPFPLSTPIDINLSGAVLLGEEESDSKSVTNSSSTDESDQSLINSDKIIPATEPERIKLIQDAHAFGHFGRDAVFKQLINKNYYWPKMRNDIEIQLKECDVCTRYVVVKKGFHPAAYITASGPGEHYQIDTSVHLPESPDGYRALLVVIDVFTGFVILKPTKDTTAITIARKLWKIFCIIGWPKILQSDNGSEFVNNILRALVKVTGIEHRFISAYNPRADGKVERSIGTVTMIIKKLLHGTTNHWPLFVPFAQIAFNNKISSLTATSPFVLMFNRSVNDLKDYSTDPDAPILISLDDWKAFQEKIISLIYPAISERIISGKNKLVQSLNKNRKQLLPTAFPTGSTVMIIDPHRSNKFEPKYIGPYTIVRRSRNGNYVLKDLTPTGDILDRHVPADQLKMISKSKRQIDEEQPLFDVNRIVKHRGEPGFYEYLVDWTGYTADEQTWESASSFLDDTVIKKYWSKHLLSTQST